MSLNGFVTAVSTRIDTLADRVFYGEKVNPNTNIPYVWWHYTSSIDVEKLEDFIFEVDVVGYANNLSGLESIIDAIDGDGNIINASGLNYWHSGSGGHPTFRCFRMSRITIPTVDEELARRQLRYRARVYL